MWGPAMSCQDGGFSASAGHAARLNAYGGSRQPEMSVADRYRVGDIDRGSYSGPIAVMAGLPRYVHDRAGAASG